MTLVTDVTVENTPIICIISRFHIERVLLRGNQNALMMPGQVPPGQNAGHQSGPQFGSAKEATKKDIEEAFND